MRGRVRRGAVLAVTAWVVAVLAAGSLSWTAIEAAGRQVAAPVVPELPGEVAGSTSLTPPATTPGAATPGTATPGTATGTASPTPSGSPTTGPTAGQTTGQPTPDEPTAAPVPPAEQVSRTVATRGGTTAATCTGGQLTVTYATPVNGWRAEIEQEGDEGARVEFRSDGDRVRVRLTCAGGQPASDVEDTSSGSGGGGGGSGGDDDSGGGDD